MERAFIREELKSNQSHYARFYLTLKAHKLKPGQMVDHLKSRQTVSCPGSLLHGLGVWVDRKLQEVAQKPVSYFKNTLEIKKTTAQATSTAKCLLVYRRRHVHVHQHPYTHDT